MHIHAHSKAEQSEMGAELGVTGGSLFKQPLRTQFLSANRLRSSACRCPCSIFEREAAPKQCLCGIFKRQVAPKQRLCGIFECQAAPKQHLCGIFERQAAPKQRLRDIRECNSLLACWGHHQVCGGCCVLSIPSFSLKPGKVLSVIF